MNKLSNLKPGDVVALFGRHHADGVRAVTIEKVGKIHLTLVGVAGKFQVRTGREIGGSGYFCRTIAPMTPGLKERCEANMLSFVAKQVLVELEADVDSTPWTSEDVVALSALVNSRKSRVPKKVVR